MNIINQYQNLPPQIYYLSLSKLIVEIGVMFVFPFMSLLLTERLGFSEIYVGYFLLISSIGSMAGSLLGGKISDEFGRKPAFIFFTSVVVAAMILGGFFCTSCLITVFVFVSYSATSALSPVVSAMIIDCSDETNRSECFSLTYLSGNMGCALGPVLAGLLFYSHMPFVFFSQALFFFAALIIVIFTVKDLYIPAKAQSGYSNAKTKHESTMSFLMSNPVLFIFLVFVVILTACYIEMDFIFPLQLNSIYGLNTGSKMSSGVWTLNGIGVIVLTPFLISIAKARKPLSTLVFSGILLAAGFSLYITGISIPVFIIAPFIWTAGEILLTTYSGVYIASVTPPTHIARSMSLYEFSRGVGKCIGPLIFGYVITYCSYGFSWTIIAIACLACSGGILFLALFNSRQR